MKLLLRAAALALVASITSLVPARADDGALLRCWKLGEFHGAQVQQGQAADCTCDGPRMVEMGPIRIGGGPGGNGNIGPDCFLSTTIVPAHYEAEAGGPYDLQIVEHPVRVILRKCSTEDCYWFFGSATCEFDREYVSGHVGSFRIVGQCVPVTTP